MVLSAARLWEAKQLPPKSPRPRPPLLFGAPNQNRHATQASVCCVPFESKRQPGSTFWNPQHRTELIVNLKQPHKSQLFSVCLWSRSSNIQSNTRKFLLYHLRKRIHEMNKVKRVRSSYVYRTLDIDAPWFGNTDIKVLFPFERRICNIDNVNFFPFVTAVSVFG